MITSHDHDQDSYRCLGCGAVYTTEDQAIACEYDHASDPAPEAHLVAAHDLRPGDRVWSPEPTATEGWFGPAIAYVDRPGPATVVYHTVNGGVRTMHATEVVQVLRVMA